MDVSLLRLIVDRMGRKPSHQSAEEEDTKCLSWPERALPGLVDWCAEHPNALVCLLALAAVAAGLVLRHLPELELADDPVAAFLLQGLLGAVVGSGVLAVLVWLFWRVASQLERIWGW